MSLIMHFIYEMDSIPHTIFMTMLCDKCPPLQAKFEIITNKNMTQSIICKHCNTLKILKIIH